MGILNKSTIEKWILPHLTIGERGFETTVPLIEVVECILHRLKTGCQWRELPTKQFFSKQILKAAIGVLLPHGRSRLRGCLKFHEK